MLRMIVLGCLVAGVLALIFFDLAIGPARDVSVIAMIACIGIWIGWSLPLEGG